MFSNSKPQPDRTSLGKTRHLIDHRETEALEAFDRIVWRDGCDNAVDIVEVNGWRAGIYPEARCARPPRRQAAAINAFDGTHP